MKNYNRVGPDDDMDDMPYFLSNRIGRVIMLWGDRRHDWWITRWFGHHSYDKNSRSLLKHSCGRSWKLYRRTRYYRDTFKEAT